MFKTISCIILLLFTAAKAQADHLLTTLYPRSVLERNIVQPMQFAPIPPSSSSYWRNTLSDSMRSNYIDNGKIFLGKPWSPIPHDTFREFSINGKRTNYESLSFALRRQMVSMVMAEIMQDSAVFLNDIIRGLQYFVSEAWWGIPAHYPKSTPDTNLQEVDLFNAETANLLVWTCYMLEDRIYTIDKNICSTIRKEVKRRILIPARTGDYSWKKYSWNHNTWTCANWLSCILFCEEDRKKQIDDIYQVLQCLDIFIDGYPEDGGCNEGVTYWDRAMGSLFECMQLLSLSSNGKIVLPQTDKIQKMASYIYNMYIGNGCYVNFAASNYKALPCINILYPLGLALNNHILTQHAAFIAKQYDYTSQPCKLFNQTGNYPAISRELCFLKLMPSFAKTEAKEAQTPSIWMHNTEIFVSHINDGLFIAAKGGHNDESHNHNDIGNFIIFANGEPLLIDLGNDTYTAKTFSSERYTLMNTRSAYHNVPIINEQEQQAGKNFKSKDANYHSTSNEQLLTIDIAQAYPSIAHVKKWKRSFKLKSRQITITEDYTLGKANKTSQLVLMTHLTPKQKAPGILTFSTPLGDYQLSYPAKLLDLLIEPIDISETSMKSSWGNQVNRILFTIKSSKKRNCISYSIKKTN